jgi:hypothetical protein
MRKDSEDNILWATWCFDKCHVMLSEYMNKQKCFLAWNNQWSLLSTLITMQCNFSTHTISDPYVSEDENSTCVTSQVPSPNQHALSS